MRSPYYADLPHGPPAQALASQHLGPAPQPAGFGWRKHPPAHQQKDEPAIGTGSPYRCRNSQLLPTEAVE